MYMSYMYTLHVALHVCNLFVSHFGFEICAVLVGYVHSHQSLHQLHSGLLCLFRLPAVNCSRLIAKSSIML